MHFALTVKKVDDVARTPHNTLSDFRAFCCLVN